MKDGKPLRKLLRIDLARQTATERPLSDQVLVDFIGGRGLGARLLWDEVGPDIDPLGPENKLILTVGPFTGTRLPTSARINAAGKSPLTHGYMYSISGGAFGYRLSRLGYMAVVIEGESEKPVYLDIGSKGVNFRAADHLWGMRTLLALYHLKNETPPSSAALVIGPAGENRVRYAGIMSDDWRQLGRGGLGAVMGAKKVKAVVVESGSQNVPIAHPEAFQESLREIVARLKEKPGTSDTFSRYGSGGHLDDRSQAGYLPTRNFRQSTFAGAPKISMDHLRDHLGLVVKDSGCYGCPVRCGKLTVVKDGDFAGASTDGPEYETLFALGSNCGVDDPRAIMAANQVCDDLGLDTISAGLSISFVMECFEQGLLTGNEWGQRRIGFGDGGKLIRLIEDIAYRRGFGDFVAEGTQRMAKIIGKGSDKFAMHVKGLELGGYEPRGVKGQAIVFAAGNRGGCHHSLGLPVFEEIRSGTRLSLEGKGKLVKRFAALRIIQDCVMTCTFAYSRSFHLDLWARAVSSVYGVEIGSGDLFRAGERINTLERLYNLREGFTAADDTLPGRLMEEKLPDGPAKGERISPGDLRSLLGDYYRAMGWDETTGVPLAETLSDLGLESSA